jgi:hypothetical protein
VARGAQPAAGHFGKSTSALFLYKRLLFLLSCSFSHPNNKLKNQNGKHRTYSTIKAKRKLLKLAIPGEFLFLLRIRFGLLSVLARLGARANWYEMEQGYLRQ